MSAPRGMPGKDSSRRFRSSRWSERLVPLTLIMLLVLLVGTILLVVLSAVGALPYFS